MKLTRREVLGAGGWLALAPKPWFAQSRRPKIAMITSIVIKLQHGEQFLDRFLEGYGWNNTWHHPPMDLVALYVDQFWPRDVSRERAARIPSMTIYPTVAEALTLGGSKLAVDGVVVVLEGGNYHINEKGQKYYPRYEFFKQTVEVFRNSGRTVPVYNDKHLSWNWDWAKEMYDTARSMGFPFMAGSGLPVTWRIPSVEMPLGAPVREAVCVAFGNIDAYDIHGLETLQCMVERRRGGETGVKWVQAYKDENFWRAHQDGVWSRELFEAALCRSNTITPTRDTFSDVFPTLDAMRRVVKNPIAYHYEHNDGVKCTLLMINGLVKDWSFAARLDGRHEPLSVLMFSGAIPPDTTANFFNPLIHHIENMILTGKPPYPVERTLLTTGLTAAAVESLYRNQARFPTPHLAIRYQPTRESTFWRT